MNDSLKITIETLETLFSKFNMKFFENKLSKPVITISPDPKRRAYGWCTSYKAWKNKKDGEKVYNNITDFLTASKEDINKIMNSGYYEINICAEHLSRPYIDTCTTLLHEMVHLHNLQKGINDTSRAGMYHNKKFKQAAEEHGLIVSKDITYGWCITELSPETNRWILDTCPYEDNFSIYRFNIQKMKDLSKQSTKQSTRKYVCPICGNIVRATKDIHVICGDCNVTFEKA